MQFLYYTSNFLIFYLLVWLGPCIYTMSLHIITLTVLYYCSTLPWLYFCTVGPSLKSPLTQCIYTTWIQNTKKPHYSVSAQITLYIPIHLYIYNWKTIPVYYHTIPIPQYLPHTSVAPDTLSDVSKILVLYIQHVLDLYTKLTCSRIALRS